MKKTIQCLMVLAITNTIISCGGSGNSNTAEITINSYDELEKASWLIGKWQNNSPEGSFTETWERKNDSTFYGKSFFIAGNDTLSSESITLEQLGKELFYIPTVKGQNNNQPVKFTLTSSTDKQLVFENPLHDFPQKITYDQITNDSLQAEISGTIEGKRNSQTFPLARAK